MKILVVGAGGVGGYFGARLAADGNDVVFAARGAHRRAMAERGLKVLSANGDLHIERPWLFEDPDDVGLCDAVLIATKLWDLAAAAELARPVLAHDSAVIPLQNGVVAEETVAELLGPQFAVGGVAHIGAEIAEPGVIRHVGTLARLVVGELDGGTSWRLEALAGALEGAGIDHKISDDIRRDIWTKFVLLTAFAGVTAYYREPIGEAISCAAGSGLHASLVREAAAVARAKGIALAADLEEKLIAGVRDFPPEMKSSMQTDLEHGRRLELEWLNGTVLRLGRELGLETPSHLKVVEALTPHAGGSQS